MTLERNTSAVLRYGSAAGIAIVAAGLLTDLIGMEDIGWNIMIIGIVIILITPFAGMIISFATLSADRERICAISALALIAITALGMIVTYIM